MLAVPNRAALLYPKLVDYQMYNPKSMKQKKFNSSVSTANQLAQYIILALVQQKKFVFQSR